jgi:hypothetical protein
MDITFLSTFTGSNLLGFGFQKEDTKYINEFNKFLESFRGNIGTQRYDLGFDVEDSPLELNEGNGIINVTF